mmetsp:Transcript_38270/g.115743  ORF Transcript_38270/g.115743 Transcript_38270/m.115743 type:complete len:294 (-) Transcript_38270:883-1764(-)
MIAFASLSLLRPSGTLKANLPAAAGSSPAGASISPAFTSSSMTLAACFCAPRPRSPARIFINCFSIAGMMAFCNFGAPPAFFHAPLAYRLTEASTSDLLRNTRTSTNSRVSLLEHSSVERRSWPNFLCSRILSTTLPKSMIVLSRITCWRFRSSGVSACSVAAYTCSKAGRSRSGQRSPNRWTSDVEDLSPASSSLSLSPLMPINITGNSRLMKGTKSIFMACGMASKSSRYPRLAEALQSIAAASSSGKSSAARALSIFSSTSASARAAPSCSPISPSRNLLKRYGWLNWRE